MNKTTTMKLITLAALAATLTLQAQTPAPAKAEPTQSVAPNTAASLPTLSDSDKLAFREAQFANRQLADFMEKVIEPQLQKIPDYVRIRDHATKASEAANRATAAIVKACPDCKIDYEALTVTRPQLSAKSEEKPKEK